MTNAIEPEPQFNFSDLLCAAPRAQALSTMCGLSVVAGNNQWAEHYLLELMAACAFRMPGSEQAVAL